MFRKMDLWFYLSVVRDLDFQQIKDEVHEVDKRNENHDESEILCSDKIAAYRKKLFHGSSYR